MKNPCTSQLLQQSNNCFYILLDSDLNISNCNIGFQKFCRNQPFESKIPFLQFFPETIHQQWKSVLQNTRQEKGTVHTATILIETEKASLHVDWNICMIQNDEANTTYYEILGVQSQKGSGEENTTIRTAVARQERRFKSVLDKLKKVLNSSLDIICVFDHTGKFTRVSEAAKIILGYELRELVGKNSIDFVYEEDKAHTIELSDNIKKGFTITNFENRYYKKDGSLATLAWSSKWEEEDQKFYGVARDVTEKKAAEAALKNSQEKYKVLFNHHPFPMFIYDIQTYMVIEVNDAAILNYGFSKEEFLNMKITDFLEDDDVKKFYNYYKTKEDHFYPRKGIWIQKKKNKDLFYAEVTANFIEFQGIEAKLISAIDRTEQIKAEKELIKINERYKFLSLATFDAIWDLDVKTNEVEWGEGVKKMFQIEDISVMKKMDGWLNNLHHEDRERVEAKLNQHFNQKESHWEDEYRFKTGENTYKYISARGYTIYDDNKNPVRMIGAMQDLTERKAHENMLEQLNFNLEKRARELSESNAELERFAYVTSHDLQEPLRMVTSFLQLLEKRYKDKLDQKAHEYIAYAVDGAERMKRLILDLLEYSRVNSSVIEKEDVNINEVIEDLRLTYKNLLQETAGTINCEELPFIKGNKTQILQLFQNLIGNAFKYKSEKSPIIDISYKEDNKYYKFSITDNGIGIDPRFFQKIFIIFQRLHKREQYTGTGIGLAICKKIVEKHGGKIWVSSAPEHGSTFYFTLPKPKGEPI